MGARRFLVSPALSRFPGHNQFPAQLTEWNAKAIGGGSALRPAPSIGSITPLISVEHRGMETLLLALPQTFSTICLRFPSGRCICLCALFAIGTEKGIATWIYTHLTLWRPACPFQHATAGFWRT